MKLLPKAASLFFALLALMLFVGCGENASFEVVNEEDETTYRRAKQLMARGKNAEALENLLKLIQKRNGRAPESHLEAGRIYLFHIQDPFSAIYHFNRFLSLGKRGASTSQSDKKIALVEDLKKTAMKEILTSSEIKAFSKVYQDPLERLKLLDTIDALRQENDALKGELGLARNKMRSAGLPLAVQSQPPVAPEAIEEQRPTVVFNIPADDRTPVQQREAPTSPEKVYLVQKSDTLSSISRKFYGDSNRWREILNANRDVLPNEHRLKVGMSLRIPETAN